MYKLFLRAGIITVGSLSAFASNFKLNTVDSNFNDVIIGSEVTNVIDLIDYEKIDRYSNNVNLIKEYAQIFEINEDVVLENILDLSNEFESPIWYKNLSTIDQNFENEEEAILTLVRDIYRNPDTYHLTSEELKTDIKYETSELCEEMVERYCDILNVNKDIALSIIYQECGHNLASYNYINNHNPAGIGPHTYFKNIEYGIIEYIFLLKNGYGCTKDSNEAFFNKIGRIYCTEGTTGWLSGTKSYYYNITNDYYYYAKNREPEKVLK